MPHFRLWSFTDTSKQLRRRLLAVSLAHTALTKLMGHVPWVCISVRETGSGFGYGFPRVCCDGVMPLEVYTKTSVGLSLSRAAELCELF